MAGWTRCVVNIYSHLLGALYYLLLVPLHFSTHHEATSLSLATIPGLKASFRSLLERGQHTHELVDTLAISIFLVSAVGCLGLSAWFHSVQCTSKSRCDSAHRGDYVGIVLLIEGSFWPCLYYGSSSRCH